MERSERLIVALDTPDIIICKKLISTLKNTVKVFKIGSELFTSCGVESVRAVQEAGCKVFLDLKFFDIPNTVANVAQVVSRLGVLIFNVHALGGSSMMKAVVEAVRGESERRGLPKPLILAVTILTSMSKEEFENDLRVSSTIEEEVVHLAHLAKECSLDGVVASAHEARRIKEKLGKDFLVVTPGIRPEWAAAGDQKRVVTPRDAVLAGADYIVVGRPITAAQDPLKAAKKIIEELP